MFQVSVACFYRPTLTAAVLGSGGTCAAVFTQGCTEGSNLAHTSSVEEDSVLKSFLRCLFFSSCCGYMLKVCVSLYFLQGCDVWVFWFLGKSFGWLVFLVCLWIF